MSHLILGKFALESLYYSTPLTAIRLLSFFNQDSP